MATAKMTKRKKGEETKETQTITVAESVNSLLAEAIAHLKDQLGRLKSEAEKRLAELDDPALTPTEFPSMEGINVDLGRIQALKRMQRMLKK